MSDTKELASVWVRAFDSATAVKFWVTPWFLRRHRGISFPS